MSTPKWNPAGVKPRDREQGAKIEEDPFAHRHRAACGACSSLGKTFFCKGHEVVWQGPCYACKKPCEGNFYCPKCARGDLIYCSDECMKVDAPLHAAACVQRQKLSTAKDYLRKDQYKQAAAGFKQVYEAAAKLRKEGKLRDRGLELDAACGLGNAYFALQRRPDALECFKAALEQARASGDAVAKAWCYMGLCMCHMSKGVDDTRRQEYAAKALELASTEFAKAEEQTKGKCDTHRKAHMARYNAVLTAAHKWAGKAR